MKAEFWLNLFKQYEWSRLHLELIEDLSEQDEDFEIYICLKVILLSSYWGEKGAAQQILNRINIGNQSFNAVSKYLLLDSGTAVDIDKIEDSSSSKFSFFNEWIRVEKIVRTRDFEKLLILLQDLNSNQEEWIYSAILNGLGYNEINTNFEVAKLIKQIKIAKGNKYLKELVILRLTSGQGYAGNFVSQYQDLILHYKYSRLAKNDLALLYKKNGRIKEAIDLLYDVLLIEPLSKKHMYELLSSYISFPHRQNEFLDLIDICERFAPKQIGTKGGLATYKIIYLWLNKSYQELIDVLVRNLDFRDVTLPKSERSLLTFYKYIALLGQCFAKNQSSYNNLKVRKLLVFGESHSLNLNGLNVNVANKQYICESKFIMGIKMHHVANNNLDERTASLKAHLLNISNFSDLMFCIGEIDTRPDEGIWPTSVKTGQPLVSIINITVRKFINNIKGMLPDGHKGMVIIQGIPAPCYDPREIIGEMNLDKFLGMFIVLNKRLQEESNKYGWIF